MHAPAYMTNTIDTCFMHAPDYVINVIVILLKASYHLLSFLSGREAAVAALIQSQEDKTDDQRPEAHIGPRR